MPQSYVVGFGALNIDYFYALKKDEDIKKVGIYWGEERVLNGDEVEKVEAFITRHCDYKGVSGGGSAANTIFAMSKMGFNSAIFGKIGVDKEGDRILKDLYAISKKNIIREGASGRSYIFLNSKGERAILLNPLANDKITIGEVKQNLSFFLSAQWIHMSSFVGSLSQEAQLFLLSNIPAHIGISLDPGEVYARKGLDFLERFLYRLRILFITQEEISLLGISSDINDLRLLVKAGPEIVICKMGAKGAYLVSRNDDIFIDSIVVDRVVDTTGAGDVFDAGFLAGILSRFSLKRSLEIAVKAASISISGYGRSKYPLFSQLI